MLSNLCRGKLKWFEIARPALPLLAHMLLSSQDRDRDRRVLGVELSV
jgi:hypothetical protein